MAVNFRDNLRNELAELRGKLQDAGVMDRLTIYWVTSGRLVPFEGVTRASVKSTKELGVWVEVEDEEPARRL